MAAVGGEESHDHDGAEQSLDAPGQQEAQGDGDGELLLEIIGVDGGDGGFDRDRLGGEGGVAKIGDGADAQDKDHQGAGVAAPFAQHLAHARFMRGFGGAVETLPLLLAGHGGVDAGEHSHEDEPEIEVAHLGGVQRIDERIAAAAGRS